MQKLYSTALGIVFVMIVSLSFYTFFVKKAVDIPLDTPPSASHKVETFSKDDIEEKKRVSESIGNIRKPIKNKVIHSTNKISKSFHSEETYDSKEMMQTHTEDMYESLKPEGFDETVQEADVAFEDLNTYIQQSDKKLNNHMQISSEEDNYMPVEIEDDTNKEYKMQVPMID